MIEVKDVSKSFKKEEVIKNVSVSFKEGEITGFIGYQNGYENLKV